MKGGVAAGLRISSSWARTSISPLRRSGSPCLRGGGARRPCTRSTNSLRTRSAAAKVSCAVRVAHHLHQALAVAQVDEDDAAVVAAAVGPAEERHGSARGIGCRCCRSIRFACCLVSRWPGAIRRSREARQCLTSVPSGISGAARCRRLRSRRRHRIGVGPGGLLSGRVRAARRLGHAHRDDVLERLRRRSSRARSSPRAAR